MKIYFNFSARAMQQHSREFSSITTAISNLGHTNISTLVEDNTENAVYNKTEDELGEMFDKSIKYIQNANIVILEVSIPSLTQGYLIYRALDIGVPVIALHLPDTPQAFTRGIKHEKFQLIEYTLDTVKTELEQAIEQAKAVMDIRFNFFISPKINAYLDALAEEKKDSKSNLLRHIIQEHMHNHPES